MIFSKDWMAFEELLRPLFREHGSIYFANGNKLSKDLNYAFCEVWLLLHRLFSRPLAHSHITHILIFSLVHLHGGLLAFLLPSSSSQIHALLQIWLLFTLASNHEPPSFIILTEVIYSVLTRALMQRGFMII